jgi:hypothetical protein
MMTLSFLKSKKTKEREAKASLRIKIQKMVRDLSWTKSTFSIEKIVDFFNYMEDALKNISAAELQVAPKYVKNVISNTGRNEYGWFRAPEGQKATPDNTYIQPTGHFDECFRTHTVRLLMNYNDQPSDQGGFAKRPMTTKEFYYVAFVKPFILDKVEALELSLKEL